MTKVSQNKLKNSILLSSGLFLAVFISGSLGNGDSFGIKAAFGYGGGGGVQVAPCSSVVYGNWGSCVSGKQYRDVAVGQPTNCALSTEQQAAREKFCEDAIAQKEDKEDKTPIKALVVKSDGVNSSITKSYAAGTLLRGADKKIYVVLSSGSLQHVATLKELAKYRGQIINVEDAVISSFKKTSVLGAKKYADGTLLRAKGDAKTYVVRNGKKVHIKTLAELRKLKGKVVTVDTATLSAL